VVRLTARRPQMSSGSCWRPKLELKQGWYKDETDQVLQNMTTCWTISRNPNIQIYWFTHVVKQTWFVDIHHWIQLDLSNSQAGSWLTLMFNKSVCVMTEDRWYNCSKTVVTEDGSKDSLWTAACCIGEIVFRLSPAIILVLMFTTFCRLKNTRVILVRAV